MGMDAVFTAEGLEGKGGSGWVEGGRGFLMLLLEKVGRGGEGRGGYVWVEGGRGFLMLLLEKVGRGGEGRGVDGLDGMSDGRGVKIGYF